MPIAHVKGTTLHYLDAGSAEEVVLLLHAFPLHSGMWGPQIEALQQRYRVIAPDYRGMGKSGEPPAASTMDLLAEDAAALLRQLGIRQATVVGLSMGGYVAFELHRREHALFRALVLCDTKAGADTEEGKLAREAFAKGVEEKGIALAQEQMPPKLLKPAPDPGVQRRVRELIGENRAAGIAAATRGMMKRPSSEPTLAQIKCPTLVMVGEQDGLTPPAESQRMAGAIAGGRLVTIPGAGHLSNLEAPQAFNQALTGFLSSLPAR
jgi:pimeloyl-ACP methyl ester carboxylesterase